MDVSSLNYSLALGTVLLQVVTAALIVIFVMRRRVVAFGDIAVSVGTWGLWIAFLAAGFGTLMAVYYSDVLGFEPCYWCYWQRYFLFPQVMLLGMAAWKKDAFIADYSIVLSVVGASVALYHHALQMAPMGALPCPATGPSCALRIFFEFGYITYPLMAFTLFVFLIIAMLFVRSKAQTTACR